MEKSQTELDPWTLYIYAMKAPITRDKYTSKFAKFLDSIDPDLQDEGPTSTLEERARAFAKRGKIDFNWAFAHILKFVQHLKERVDRKEITGATVRNYVKSIKLFCEMADIPIPWKKITRGLPKGKRYADDRIPTIDEIRKLVEYPDRRIKAIVYTMSSSGIRIGAWDYLRWDHVRPILRDGQVVAAKLLVYGNEDEEYFSFISSEAWKALNDWMDYRKSSGEQINAQSWLMRNLWDTRVAQGRGLVTKPKKLSALGVKRLVERAIWAQGLRTKLEPGKKRHPFQANHSLRKWFKTRCEIAGMKPINTEVLLNHSTGISDSYYRATENELLQDFLKAVTLLCINEDTVALRKQVTELTERSKDNEYIIRGKLEERDKQITELAKKQERFESLIQSLIDSGHLKGESAKA